MWIVYIIKKVFDDFAQPDTSAGQQGWGVWSSILEDISGEVRSALETGAQQDILLSDIRTSSWNIDCLSHLPGSTIVTRVECSGEPSRELTCLLERDDAFRLGYFTGIIAGRYIPVIKDYGLSATDVFCVSGSHLYNLDSWTSDFDILAIDEGPKNTLCNTLGQAAVHKILGWEDLAQRLARGERRSWELATATPGMRSSSSHCSRVLEIADQAQKRLNPESFLASSKTYIEKYAPHLLGSVSNDSYPDTKRWKARRGWAYKIGYYILVDSVLSSHAWKTGVFNLLAPFSETPELKSFALDCKDGKIFFDDWIAFMEKTCHRSALEAIKSCCKPRSS